ncbi:hypothetical protein BKI52_04235 [marine bacterium AO1-C]|nr:hypothetical protein BKI52_04235 [marine bacterium AO1-C]
MLIRIFTLQAFLLCVFSLFQTQVQAQNGRIQEIKEIYQQVKKQVNNREESSFHKDQLITNHQSPNPGWPAVGVYSEAITAYYSLGTEEGKTYYKNFRLIDIQGKRSAYKEKTEILYDNKGRLMFIYAQTADYEYRFYFDNQGKIIRLLKGKNQIKSTASASQIARQIQQKAVHLIKTLREFY